MKRYQQGFTVVELFVAILFLGGGFGWCWNIVKLVQMLHDNITVLAILRGVGVFAPPLGAIMGFV